MKYSFLKLPQLSGKCASIYTIRIENDDKIETLLDQFIKANEADAENEVKDIIQRLHTIGHKTGAREHFFKHNEGKPGDGVCALFDAPDKYLRLYCIRNGSVNVILGSGGAKPKHIRALQEDETLTIENHFMRKVSELFTQRLKAKEMSYSKNGMNLEGNLIFTDRDLF
jgi:hypothetical protein